MANSTKKPVLRPRPWERVVDAVVLVVGALLAAGAMLAGMVLLGTGVPWASASPNPVCMDMDANPTLEGMIDVLDLAYSIPDLTVAQVDEVMTEIVISNCPQHLGNLLTAIGIATYGQVEYTNYERGE